ncbi:Yip1 family protein [uncultured Eubacterium sp.]|jgi:membrane protein|uniref:Yip1 family protein n=1 Tax=uncultured Eubacterium sp. TaxID=165185 RepID=UPI0026169176|nr:Yip1 family protein [uncultured Eubacterium sp.]
MAKFCMYCGRPLAEGEVCNCQNNANTQETAPQTADTNTQANAPAAEANVQPDNTNAQAQTAAQNDYNQGANPNQNFNQGGPIPNQNFNQGFNQNYNGNQGMPYGAAPQQAHSSELGNKIKFVFSKIAGMFKSPSATIKEFIAKDDLHYGAIMMAINIIGVFIISLIEFLYLNNKLYDMLPVAKLLLVTVIIAVINTFGAAGLLYAFTNKTFKSNTSIAHIFAIKGVTSVLSVCLQVVTIIFTLLSAKLGLVLSVVAFIYTSVIFIANYVETVKLDTDKKSYALLITYSIVFIVEVIIFYLFISSIVSGALGSVSSLFSNIGSLY